MSYFYKQHAAALRLQRSFPPPPPLAAAADAPSSAAVAPPPAVCLVRQESQHIFDLDKISALGIRTRVDATSAPDLIFIKDGQRLSFLIYAPPPNPGGTGAAHALPPALLERAAACARTAPSLPSLLLPLSWASSPSFARLCADCALRGCARLCPTVVEVSAAGVTDAALRLADELFCRLFEQKAGGGGAAAARQEAASAGAAGDVLLALASSAAAAAAAFCASLRRGDVQHRQQQQQDLAERLARVMQGTPGSCLASLARALAGKEGGGGQGGGDGGERPAPGPSTLLSREEARVLRELLLLDTPQPPLASD